MQIKSVSVPLRGLGMETPRLLGRLLPHSITN